MLRKITTVAAIALVLYSSSCDTRNAGGWPIMPVMDGPGYLSIGVPWESKAGEVVAFTVQTWDPNSTPMTVEWDFGGGAEPNNVSRVISQKAGSFSFGRNLNERQEVTLSNYTGGTYEVTVKVTDGLGFSSEGSSEYTYAATNQAPELTVVAGDGTTIITVIAEDPDSAEVQIIPVAPAGFSFSSPQTVFAGDTATFEFSAFDILAGGMGTATFEGNDGESYSNQVSTIVNQDPIVLAANTLYAIPVQSRANFGDTVTVIVGTGVPASPFQFMNGCRVTALNGFDYADNTFNVGVPGGAAGDVDGFWTQMNPGGGFLLAPDNFIVATGNDVAGPGRSGVTFNVTPIGGSDQTTASGALFNFGAAFAAGLNVLGFQDVQGVNRTYYSDSSETEYFWGDISNNHAGVPNNVMVE